VIPTLLAIADAVSGLLATWWATHLTWLRLKLRGAQVGSGLRTRGLIDLHIHRNAQVCIGPNCRFKSGFAENAVGGFRRLGIWVGPGGQLTLGRGVGISSSTIVCMQAVTIEDEVYIGGDCNIYDTDFHSLIPEARLARPDNTVKTAPIVIRRRSFIGGHSVILKGVTIGEAAVIGAGSVVTTNVPPGEIWAGNPARCIGRVGAASETTDGKDK
jgi:acetyltransferase-like isoleucine patch superfamily enzyme